MLMMGFATNNLLPGRLGEFWRAYLLGRKRNVRKTFALASVVVERVFDGLTLIALLALVSMTIQLPGWGRQIELLAAADLPGGHARRWSCCCGSPRSVQVPLRDPAAASTAAWRPGSRSASKRSSTAWRRSAGRVLLAALSLSLGVWAFEARLVLCSSAADST